MATFKGSLIYYGLNWVVELKRVEFTAQKVSSAKDRDLKRKDLRSPETSNGDV